MITMSTVRTEVHIPSASRICQKSYGLWAIIDLDFSLLKLDHFSGDTQVDLPPKKVVQDEREN